MSYFGNKTPKSESADNTPYTIYYPHTIEHSNRVWLEKWYQVASIDPAKKNFALRIEKRYFTGLVQTIVFEKVAVAEKTVDSKITICNTYENISKFLNKYKDQFLECHYIIIERQLPQNYQATRISQHTISYFSVTLHNNRLLTTIIEVDPKLKGKILGAPKNITNEQLKSWAVEYARKLLTQRNDTFALKVMDYYGRKQDDLADTIAQIEALFVLWGITNKVIDKHADITNMDNIMINNNNLHNFLDNLDKHGPTQITNTNYLTNYLTNTNQQNNTNYLTNTNYPTNMNQQTNTNYQTNMNQTNRISLVNSYEIKQPNLRHPKIEIVDKN
jgi:hypothetical protein